MFERIIVAASDISPTALEALKGVVDLKPLGAKSCLLLQCQPAFDLDQASMTYLADQIDKSVQNQLDYLIANGFSAEARIVFGLTRSEANRIADEEDYSLIAAGAARHTLIGGLLSGGIAFEIIHNVRRPVLLIRVQEDRESAPADQPPLLDHVLYLTDFSDNAVTAFGTLEQMASAVNKITLLHIQDKSRIDPEKLANLESFNAKDRDRLHALREKLLAKGATKVDTQLVLGSPSEEALHFVDQHDVTLVVMGSQGRGFIREVFMGSVSNNVARHCASSVLLVPAERA